MTVDEARSGAGAAVAGTAEFCNSAAAATVLFCCLICLLRVNMQNATATPPRVYHNPRVSCWRPASSWWGCTCTLQLYTLTHLHTQQQPRPPPAPPNPAGGRQADGGGIPAHYRPPITHTGTQTIVTTQHPVPLLQVAGKQMVGVYLSVWARRSLLPHIHGVQMLSIATGALGYFGNKGGSGIVSGGFTTK